MLNDDGRTTSSREKILTITVKRGWSEGTKVTFSKEGDQGPNRIPGKGILNTGWSCTFGNIYTADIIFEVKDKPHPLFKREGTDIIFEASIPLLVVSSLDLHVVRLCNLM